ncbi:retrovirus-related pol polyprotein from transposon TNT 1-94 [Tanacetum coccineum]
MLAPNPSSYYNGGASFVNLMHLKKDQFEKPCLYKVPYDKDDLGNIFTHNCDEILILEAESRSKLDKGLVNPYDYTYQNSLYELFTPQTQNSHDQLYFSMKLQKKLWRKSFVKYKPNVVKNIEFLPNQSLMSKNLLMPLAEKTRGNAREFKRVLKEKMFDEYVQSLEKELYELQSDINEFSNEYDLLLQECLTNSIICATLSFMTDIDEYSAMACKYLEKVKEYLKAQLQNKNNTISELKKLIEKLEGKSVETKFDKPPDVCHTNEIKVPKPSVLGKPTPFLDSLEKRDFSKPKSVTKTDVSKWPKQTRASQLPQSFRNTNPYVSTSTGVIHKTRVSGPQLRSNQVKDKVMQNNSQVKIKQKEVEDHHRISSFSNKTKSITACNDSLKSRTLNVNVVYATCGKCVFNSIHDSCVSTFLNDVNARSKKPQVVPVRPRKPLRKVNQSIATPLKKTVALDSTIHKSRSYYRMLYEKTSKAWTWKCNDQEVYYVEGLNHNLLFVGQFCDTNLEVAFRKYTCYIRDLQGNDLFMGTRRSDLYTIALQESSSPTLICFLAKASPTQAWLWHHRLSYLNFDTINLVSKNDIVNGLPKLKFVKHQLFSSCEMGKAKISSFKSLTVTRSKKRLDLLHIDLCGPMRIETINGKKYILVIVDDYSRYTWTLFLRSKDENPEVLKDFLKMIQCKLQAQKQLQLHVTPRIDLSSSTDMQRHHTTSLMKGNLLSNTFTFLAALVT